MRTITKPIAAAAIVLSFCLSSFSQQVAKTIPYAAAPEGLIGFLQFTPPDYGSQKHPLIIFLHGIGERGNGTTQINSITANAIPNYCAHGATMRFTVNGVTSSFVVLSPQLSTQLGYWPTYYAKQMIAYAKANLQIDPNRIYVCGLSLGGGGVWRLITDTQNFDHTFDGTIAAAAPVCGTQEETDADFCSTIGANHLPIWAFHSMDDGTVGVGATQHAQILSNNCGVTPASIFTYYQSGGHVGAWIHAYDTGHITVPVVVNGVVSNFTAVPNLYEWFLSKTRATTTQTNTAPVASAGNPQTITLPASTVTLTGSGSGTNGATISSYAWTKTSGPSGGSISSPSAATTSVTGLTQGTYVFTLTVTDNHGLTGSSTITITVNSAYTAPVAIAGLAQIITLPISTITLTGTGTGTNGASISSYAWTKTSGPSGGVIVSVNAALTVVTGLAQGTYVFTLTVTDNHGLTSSSSVTITVNPLVAGNKSPVANAGADIVTSQPNNSVQLDGSASNDPDGSIVKYQWTYSGAGPAMIENATAAKATMINLSPGTYAVTLTVTDNNGATATDNLTITVKTAAAAPAAATPIGYIKQSVGQSQACADASSTGRTPIYSSSIANGNIVYLDAAHTTVYNGGYNWFSFTSTVGGTVTQAFSIYPDGTINLLAACAQSTTPVTTPSGNLLGYIKLSTGPYQACADASSAGRIAVYGSSIANGSNLYTDAAMTQPYNGGWNWYSFTPTLGGTTTYAFAIYPVGGILLLRNCATGGSSRVAGETTTADEDIATLQRLKDSAALADPTGVKANGLSIFPNPVHTTATVQLYSAENAVKVVTVYNTNGVLKAKYTWQAVQGNNTFTLKDVSSFANGLYIIDIRDSNGKSNGTLKFIKL